MPKIDMPKLRLASFHTASTRWCPPALPYSSVSQALHSGLFAKNGMESSPLATESGAPENPARQPGRRRPRATRECGHGVSTVIRLHCVFRRALTGRGQDEVHIPDSHRAGVDDVESGVPQELLYVLRRDMAVTRLIVSMETQ